MAIHVVEASAQEAAAAQAGVVTFVKEAEDQPALAEREAQERVMRMKAESVVVLVSARGEAEGFACALRNPT
jgi:hypothetical protein